MWLTTVERFLTRGMARVLIFTSSALTAACSSSASNGRPLVKFSVDKDVVYTPGDWPELVKADVYRPAVIEASPAVLLIHGGSWAENDNRYQMAGIAKQLARRGYLVVNATYRLAPRWNYPAPVEDLRQALNWIKTNAKQLNIDLKRVALYGYSAGGHLAEMVGFKTPPEGLGVRAIIAGATPQDLTLDPDFPVVPVFIGTTFKENPELYRQASPLNNVSTETPPLFIYKGTKDKIVPPEHTYRLLPKLKKNKVRHEVHWVRGRGHISTFLFPDNAVGEAIDFLDREIN